MIPIRKYRALISGFMMALYLFIIVPVQIWHDHSLKEKDTPGISSEKKLSVFANDTKAKPAIHHCNICNHHYSFYADDKPTVNTIFPTTVDLPFQEYLLNVPEIGSDFISNKGPPILS